MNQEIYNVYQLAPDCQVIEEANVRCFLFEGDRSALLVDTGFGGGNLRGLVSSLTEKPVTVINTHADRDHIGGNDQFDQVWMHPSEYDRYCQNRGSAGTGIRFLWEGTMIDTGRRCFEVILIPGHTPGSIALLDQAAGVLLAGDTVQDSDIFMFKPGRNMEAYISSLEKLNAMAAAGKFRQVYPSHGTIPLPAEVIPQLMADAKLIIEGKVEGREEEMYGASVNRFLMKSAQFLCDRTVNEDHL